MWRKIQREDCVVGTIINFHSIYVTGGYSIGTITSVRANEIEIARPMVYAQAEFNSSGLIHTERFWVSIDRACGGSDIRVFQYHGHPVRSMRVKASD